MKSEHTVDSIALERAASDIAPAVRQAFSTLRGPDERVLRAIREEAARHVFVLRRQHVLRVRIIAAAAVLLFLCGSLQLHLSRQAGLQQAQTLRLVLHMGAPQAFPASPEGTDELARQLLSIQGLDEESFFSPDDAGSLSL